MSQDSGQKLIREKKDGRKASPGQTSAMRVILMTTMKRKQQNLITAAND